MGEKVDRDQKCLQTGALECSDVGLLAKRVLESLRICHAQRFLDPYWGNRFWAAVHQMEHTGEMTPMIMELLGNCGYAGPQTLSPPMFEELEQELAALAPSKDDSPHSTDSQISFVVEERLEQLHPCPADDTPAQVELPWDVSKPLTMKEVKAHADAGDDLAAKALSNVQRLAMEKQPAAGWAMLHRLALQQGRK